MAFYHNLIRNVKAMKDDPLQLIILIVIVAFTIDLILKGKIGLINFSMKKLVAILNYESWQLPAIILLILFWEK